MNISGMKMFFRKGVLKFHNGYSRSMCSCKDSTTKRPWRNSATLLIVAPVQESLHFLVMTRSQRSKFMPGGVVFPGGVISPSDSSKRWLDLYETTGLNLKNPKFFSPGAHLPFIYTDKDGSWDDSISREVSLRITAIREMFEECGVLLCKPIDERKISISDRYHFKELSDKRIISEWQEKSRNNAEEFLNLCEKLACIPDLSVLGDWSNWLTPTTFPGSRFNTMFYMAVLPQPLPVFIDTFEVEEAKWATATTLLQENKDKKINLLPPQIYELTRLKDIKDCDHMERLLEKRKQLGVDLFFPVFVGVKDGAIIFKPGDDLYPQTPDFYTKKQKQIWPKTIEEYRNSTKNHHRAEVSKDGTFSYAINNVRYGHYYT